MVFGPAGYRLRQDLLQPKQNRLGGKRHQQTHQVWSHWQNWIPTSRQKQINNNKHPKKKHKTTHLDFLSIFWWFFFVGVDWITKSLGWELGLDFFCWFPIQVPQTRKNNVTAFSTHPPPPNLRRLVAMQGLQLVRPEICEPQVRASAGEADGRRIVSQHFAMGTHNLHF